MNELHKKQIGKKSSESTKRKESFAKIGKKRGPMSEETKAKISFANSAENISDETRRRKSESKYKAVLAVNNETGEGMVFKNHELAAEYFGVRDSSITRWINGTRKPTNGFSFYRYSPTTTECEGAITRHATV